MGDTLQNPHVTTWNYVTKKWEVGIIGKSGSAWESSTGANYIHQLGKIITKNTGKSVRIVSVVQGGTTLDKWSGGATGNPDTSQVTTRLRLDVTESKLKKPDAFIWGHGEGGLGASNGVNGRYYYEEYIELIAYLRTAKIIDTSTKVLTMSTADTVFNKKISMAITSSEGGLRATEYDADPNTAFARLENIPSDGIHWTPKGHEAIAPILYAKLQRMPLIAGTDLLGFGSVGYYNGIGVGRSLDVNGMKLTDEFGVPFITFSNTGQSQYGYNDAYFGTNWAGVAGAVGMKGSAALGNPSFSWSTANGGRWYTPNYLTAGNRIEIVTSGSSGWSVQSATIGNNWYGNIVTSDNGNFVLQNDAINVFKVFRNTSHFKIDKNLAPATDISGAIFQVNDTSEGSLPKPRLTTVQRLAIKKNFIGLNISNAGTGYTTATMTLSGGGSTLQTTGLVFASGGQIQYSFNLVQGDGYTSAPTVVISGNGTGAVATAIIAYPVGLTVFDTNLSVEMVWNGTRWIQQGSIYMTTPQISSYNAWIGMRVYDTDRNTEYVWNGTTWDATTSKGFNHIVRETPSGAVNSANVAFTVANNPVMSKEEVYSDGILQDYGSDYTMRSNAITFATAPLTGKKIRISYLTEDSYSDDFNRADTAGLGKMTSAPLVSWVQANASTWAVSSNKAINNDANTGTASERQAYVETFSPNVTVKCDVTYSSTISSARLVVRYIDDNNYIMALVYRYSSLSCSIALYKVIAGVTTQIGTSYNFSETPSSTHSLKVIADGNYYNFYYDNIVRVSYTGTTGLETGTKHGIGVFKGTQAGFCDEGSQFDNFSIK